MAQDPSKENFNKHLQIIQDELSVATDKAGRINLDAVRQRNAPLARVIDEFMMSKTTRDVGAPVAFDVATALEASQPDSSLAKALGELGKQLAKEPNKPAK